MPERLGKYELMKRIGRGGMAHVWMARRLGEGSKSVAIKRIAPERAHDEKIKRLFREEAQLALPLSHSNIAQVFDVGQEGDDAYLVMEWVDGLNLAHLRELMDQQGMTMPVHLAVYIIAEVAQALAYAHAVEHCGSIGVLHRDVSPGNVMVSVSGEVKLTDFGIARAIRDHTTQTTNELLPPGKVCYAAPEQFGVAPVREPTADLFPLGAMLHELLTLRQFREGLNLLQIAKQLADETADNVPPLDRDDVPQAIETLIRELLEFDPSRRPQSADAVLDRLEGWDGYRNAARELGRLCKQLLGVERPRSGLSTGSSAATPSDATEPDTAGVTAPDTDPLVGELDPGDATPADRDVTPPGLVPAQERRPVGRSRAMNAALLVAGLGILGAGMFSLYQVEAVAPRTSALAVPAEAKPAAPVNEATERTPLPETKAAPVVPIASEPQKPEPPAPDTKATRQNKPPKTPAKRERVPVKFVLDGPRLAHILIDGRKEVILQPRDSARLTVGKHRLEWKLKTDAPWRKGPMIELESARSYVVDVTDNGPKISRRRSSVGAP